MTDAPQDPQVAIAQAEAEAAAARAAAAQAAAEAAEAKLRALKAAAGAAGGPAPAAPAAPEPSPAQAPESAADTSWAAEVAAAYAFGHTIPLGALVEDGEASPSAQVGLPLAMMNRHGLVAGATGTGKTKTLQGMAEGLSAAGVPVFVADIKGDLSGLAAPGTASDRLLERTTSIGQDWRATSFPVEFYTLGGVGSGTPIRTTVTDFGPLLLSKVLGLNTDAGVQPRA